MTHSEYVRVIRSCRGGTLKVKISRVRRPSRFMRATDQFPADALSLISDVDGKVGEIRCNSDSR